MRTALIIGLGWVAGFVAYAVHPWLGPVAGFVVAWIVADLLP